MKLDEKKVRIRMIEADKTAKEIMAESGLSKNTVYFAINGRGIRKGTAYAIARVIGVGVEEILMGD